MVLVDVNVLVYAWDRRASEHAASIAWLDAHLSGTQRVGLPWESLMGFLRIVTNPRIYQRPATVQAAWRQVESWLEAGPVWIPIPGPAHAANLAKLMPHLGGGANLIPDAHLAALAIANGLTLISTDGDFARFPGLTWVNPLLKNSN